MGVGFGGRRSRVADVILVVVPPFTSSSLLLSSSGGDPATSACYSRSTEAAGGVKGPWWVSRETFTKPLGVACE